MAKKDIRGHLGGKRIQLCFMIFNLFFLMNVVSSWKVKVNFAHVKPHASNLLFVGLLCAAAVKKIIDIFNFKQRLLSNYQTFFTTNNNEATIVFVEKLARVNRVSYYSPDRQCQISNCRYAITYILFLARFLTDWIEMGPFSQYRLNST